MVNLLGRGQTSKVLCYTFFLFILLIALGVAGCDLGQEAKSNKYLVRQNSDKINVLKEDVNNEAPSLEILHARLLREISGPQVKDIMENIYQHYPTSFISMAKNFLENELEGAVDESTAHVVAYGTGEKLLYLAMRGSNDAYEYLKAGAKTEYWVDKNIRWFQSGKKIDYSIKLLTRSFQASLHTSSYQQKDRRKIEETFQVFKNLYDRAMQQSKSVYDMDVLLDGYVYGLILKNANYDHSNLSAQLILSTYLSDEYPSMYRGLGFQYADPVFIPEIYDGLIAILENPKKKSQWPLVIQGIAATSNFSNERSFEYLKSFIENRFVGEVDREEFEALVEVPFSLALLYQNFGKTYLLERSKPAEWAKNPVSWTFKNLKKDTLELYLAQLYLKAYMMSKKIHGNGGDEDTRMTLEVKSFGRNAHETEVLTRTLQQSENSITSFPSGLLVHMEFYRQRKNAAKKPWKYPF